MRARWESPNGEQDNSSINAPSRSLLSTAGGEDDYLRAKRPTGIRFSEYGVDEDHADLQRERTTSKRSTLLIMVALTILAASIICLSLYFNYDKTNGNGCAILIDTDMGFDDIIAISTLLNSPLGRCIRTITAVNGLQHPLNGTRAILQMIGAVAAQDGGEWANNIQVATGAAVPLDPAQNAFPVDWRNQCETLTGMPTLRNSPLCPTCLSSLSASDLILQTLSNLKNEQGGGIQATILALGPWTNLAPVFSSASPQLLVSSISRVVMMGGTVQAPGNAPNNVSEWNIYVDGLAASTGFASLPSAIPIVAMGLDVTQYALCSTSFTNQVQISATNAVRAAGHMSAEAISFFCGYYPGMQLFDPVAAAYLIQSSLISTTSLKIHVPTYGDNDGAFVLSDGGRPVKAGMVLQWMAMQEVLLSAISAE